VKTNIISIILMLNFYNSVYSQELILEEGMYFKYPKPGDGIWVEKPNKTDTSRYKYSKDNISYKVGTRFIYDYCFIDKAGVKRKFIVTKNQTSKENPLNLTSYTDSSDSTIDKIMLAVTDAKETYPACVGDSTCTQTVISYSYLKKTIVSDDTLCNYFKSKNSSNVYCQYSPVATGIYDNKKNIWMHPPRQYTFKMLQLSPFPFYQLDESVKYWAWNVEVGGSYLDPRWVDTKENIKVRYDYERQKDKTIRTVFGRIKCKVTTAKGTSQSGDFIMKTSLKSYYNPAYGFVKLEYKNIDDSKIVIQLVEIAN
jgi:hypothetical protein